MNPSQDGIQISKKISDVFSKEDYKIIMDMYQEMVLKMGQAPGVNEEDIMNVISKLNVSTEAKVLCAYRIGMSIGSIITFDTAQPVIYTNPTDKNNAIVRMIFGDTAEDIIQEIETHPEISEEEAKIRLNFKKLKLKFMDASLQKLPELGQLREIATALFAERPDLFTELDIDMFDIKTINPL